MKYKLWVDNKSSFAVDDAFERIYGIHNISSTSTLCNFKKGKEYTTSVFYGIEDIKVKTFDVKCIDLEKDDNGKEFAYIQFEEYIEI